MGGAYAYVLLSVFMRIQLSILGGRMFGNINKVGGSDDPFPDYIDTKHPLLDYAAVLLIRGVDSTLTVLAIGGWP